MIQGLLVWFIKLTPSTKRWFWRVWYNLFANKSKAHSFRFMNYGYEEKGFDLGLLKEDEKERYPIQLYHHTATQVDIAGKKVLEVGSGRGGGASYIQRYLKTSSLTGIDISESAIQLCKTSHKIEGLDFVKGDSENIPFLNDGFDVVLNVESSHCYGNIPVFLSEVVRVLKPGGNFLWCDFRTHKEMENLFNMFAAAGLNQIKEKDITQNILFALDLLTPERKEQIETHVPKAIRGVFKSYAGIQGGDVHKAFLAGEILYKSAAFEKGS